MFDPYQYLRAMLYAEGTKSSEVPETRAGATVVISDTVQGWGHSSTSSLFVLPNNWPMKAGV